MSDIDELEKYEHQPTPLSMDHPKRSEQARRNNRKWARRALANAQEAAAFVRSGNYDRPQPSLPRIKWLERPDP